MKNMNEIINSAIPIITVAVFCSGLTTVSVQGIKGFLNIDITGNKARVVTIASAIFWSWSLTMYFGGGSIQDAAMVFAMTFLGATGLYEVIMQKKADKGE